MSEDDYDVMSPDARLNTMTTKPDLAAVRCMGMLDDPFSSKPTAIVITEQCALPQGRRLAEAVLTAQHRSCGCQLCELARAYLAALDRKAGETPEPAANGRPRIVCLCGSTRFYREFMQANFRETMAGRIVLSVGFAANAPSEMAAIHGEGVGITAEQKVSLDELHKRKIDLADEVLVLNVGGYIGSSTRSEIDYAVAHGKPVRYLEGETPEREAGIPLSPETTT